MIFFTQEIGSMSSTGLQYYWWQLPSCVGAITFLSWRRLQDLLDDLKCLFQMSLKYHFCCVVCDFSFAGTVDKLKVNKGRI